MLKAILIVSLLSVENGWIIARDKTELVVASMEACEAKRRDFAKRMEVPKEKGTQWIAICRPLGTPL